MARVTRSIWTARGSLSLHEEQREVYALLYQQVERFRRKRGDMAIRDFEALKKNYEEAMAKILAEMSPQQIVRAFSPEQRVKVIEAFAETLPPEAREELRKKLS